MSAKRFFCGVLLVMCSNVWAADAVPKVEAPKTSELDVIEIELPAGFIEATPIPVPVAEPGEPGKPEDAFLPYEMEAGYSYSLLNNGYVDWSGAYVNAEMKLGSRNNIYGSVRKENRYAKVDTEMMGGIYDPINEYLTVIVEASASTTHFVLPSRAFFGQLQYEGAKGWIGGVGLRHTEYNASLVNLFTPTLERSWGNYRVAYTRYLSYFSGHGTVNSNQLQFAKYYGNRNWVGVTTSSGNELETLPTSQMLSSHVRTLVVSGRHWIISRIALTYNIGSYHQGSFYTRNGVQLGLRYQF